MSVAQTVTGPVAVEELGFTLPHEHTSCRPELVRTRQELMDFSSDAELMTDELHDFHRTGLEVEPLRANLAVIPQQYVRTPPTAPPATAPAVAAQSNHWPTASNISPHSSSASLPQLDLSFLDALAGSQVSQATAASSLSTPTHVAADGTNTKAGVQQAAAAALHYG